MQSSLQQYMHTLLLSKSQANFSKLTLIVDNARLSAPPPPTVVDEKPSSRRDLLSKSVSDRSIFRKVRHSRWTPELPPVVDEKPSSRRDLFSKSVSDRSILKNVRHSRWTPELPLPVMPALQITEAAIALIEEQETRWNNHTQAPPVTPRRPREKGFYVRQSSDSLLIQPERHFSPNKVLHPR
jgi:hypothetical protein